jgi:hypothetical protein
LGPVTVVLDASDGNLPFLIFVQVLATGPTLQQILSHNHCQQQQQPSFSNTHNIDLPIQKWHTVEVVVSTHKVQSTCKEAFIGYCTQRFAVSCNVLHAEAKVMAHMTCTHKQQQQ